MSAVFCEGNTVMALWYVILVVTILVFILLHAFVLPRLFLGVHFSVGSPSGRGVKVLREVGGTSIIYSAAVPLKKYISHYILSERDGRKQVVCKVNGALKYINYDIALYDKFNTVFQVLNVREVIEEKGYTKAVDVPAETAYATIYLNEADGVKLENKIYKGISGKRWALFLAVCAIAEILAVFTVRACLANIFGGLFGEAFMYSSDSNALAWVICLAIIVLNAVFMVLIVKLKERQVKKR